MSLLGLSQLRFLLRARWSTLSVLVGLTLGVAAVVAVHQIGSRINASLEMVGLPHLDGLTELLDRDGANLTDADYFALRARWRAGEYTDVRALVPMVEGQRVMAGRRALVVGVDWIAASSLPASGSGIDGRALIADGRLLVDGSFGLRAGESIEVGGASFQVEGVLDADLGGLVLADLGIAQTLLGLPPQALSQIGVRRSDPYARASELAERVLPGISAGFARRSSGWQPEGWRARSISAEQPSLGFARSVVFNVGALGLLVLVVAWFLIYQIAIIWHRRRRLLNDRLEAMGVSRIELTRGFVRAFFLLGLVASFAGLLGGVVLARGLGAMTTLAADAAGQWPPITGWLLLKAGVSGMGVGSLSAWMACRREWGSGSGAPTWILAGVLLAVAAAGVYFPVTGLFGGFAAVLALGMLVVAVVQPMLEALRASALRLRGRLLNRHALREVAWYPRDLSVAVGALSLAVATSMAVGLMVESFRTDFAQMLDQRLAHDLYVDGGGRDLADVHGWLLEQPSVDHVQPYGRARHRVGTVPIELGYSPLDEAEAARYGVRGGLGPGEALVSERLAGLLGADVGDRLALGGGLRIAGVFSGFGEAGYRVLVDESVAADLGIELVHDRLSVSLAADDQVAGADLDARLLAAFPGVEVEPRGRMRQVAMEIFDRTFAITSSLTLLALLVAAIGVHNSLVALRLNQQQGVHLLVMLGVTAGELARVAVRRALGIGSVAVALALPLGVLMAWLLCAVINPRAFGWTVDLHLALSDVAVPLALGIGAAVLAGLLPSPRDSAGEI
ncbi:MAG TPA: ABC transporter permease [Pseudomonadales bacterium]